jgi:hypothetical protein
MPGGEALAVIWSRYGGSSSVPIIPLCGWMSEYVPYSGSARQLAEFSLPKALQDSRSNSGV